MSKKFVDIRTNETEPEVIDKIASYLKSQGFQKTRSKNKNLWKRGVIWTIFASCQFSEGLAHIEVYNYAPIPGMGSFLVYFINRGKIPLILEGLQKVVAGEKVETPQPDTKLMYAGFWRRFGAFVIDTLLFYLVIGGVSAIFLGIVRGTAHGTTETGRDAVLLIMNILTILSFAVLWLYYAIMESSSSQATLGKKLFHIKVTDLQGNRLSFGKATARFWSKAISFFILGIGFLITAFTKKKQALHDMMAGTLVVQN
jgi:uncharacterized RDD family membrane protein YckC